MAESVLSHINQALTDSVVAELNSQDEQHVPSSSVASGSGVVSDLATIVEAVTLGDTSEEEAVATHTVDSLLDSITANIPPAAQPQSSSLCVAKQVSSVYYHSSV